MRCSMENSQWEQEKTIEKIDDKLKDLQDQVNKMEKENREFFEELGISPHQVEDILSDRKRYSKASYEYIQQQRQKLEEALENRIIKANSSIKREQSIENPPIKGHWIFVR